MSSAQPTTNTPTPERWDNEIPSLKDLMDHGGRPGCSYAYIDLPHLPEAQANGWKALQHRNGGLALFTLVGPTGEQSFAVAEMGKPVKGISPQAHLAPLFVSSHLLASVGMGEPVPEPEPIPVSPAPVAVKTVKAPLAPLAPVE